MNSRLLLAASLVLTTPFVYAQNAQPAPAPSAQAVPAPPPDHGRGDWGSKGGWDHGDGDRDRGMSRDMDRGRSEHGWDRGGMRDRGDHMMPFGMWWKNSEVAARIGLSADQQKRIDDLFLQSRMQLIHLHATLQEEQLMLEPLMDASTFDQGKAIAQIDKIADTRADLEKTNAKMLLSIRGVLTADQWTKLRSHDHGPHRMGGAWGDHGTQGPQGSPNGEE